MPRPRKLSRDLILSAALALIDAHGLSALSMRRLAAQLGVEAVSVYRYLPSKAAVLDGVHEKVLQGMSLPKETGDWRTDARTLALTFRRVLLAHPETVPLFATRPAITTGSLAYVERTLRILVGPFPDPTEQVHVFQSLVGFVLGQAMLQRWNTSSPSVDYRTLDVADFPHLTRTVTTIQDYDSNAEFEVGLAALLDGFAMRMEHIPERL